MSIFNWINQNTLSLCEKKVAISGSTGGLGKELCRHLAGIGAELILMDRNPQKVENLTRDLKNEFAKVKISTLRLDLCDMGSVKSVCEQLKAISPDVIILNAGAYSVPRFKCDTGFNNLFQINFASPYYLVNELLPTLRQNHGRVVAVGSIAHNYSKTDMSDVDFSDRKKASLVYGNAKRFLMFSLFELFKDEHNASLSVVHPGITLTGITDHYPKIIYVLIKHPMKVIFMSPKKASLSIVKGVFEGTRYHRWIGPKLFNIWGYPKNQSLKTCGIAESRRIAQKAEEIYSILKNIKTADED